MKEGDLLHIRGQNEDGTSTKWFAELVGIDEDGKLEVYFLEQTNKMGGHIWAYASDWQTIDKETVQKVITPDKNHYVKSYKEYGFVPTVEENQFLKVGDTIPSHIMTPIPLDSDQEGQMKDDDSDMDDFIVDDDEANEPFTHAPPNTEFVRDVHQAVNQYNGWEPQNGTERNVKVFIDNLADKYQRQDDNRQFVRGRTVDYSKPPTRE